MNALIAAGVGRIVESYKKLFSLTPYEFNRIGDFLLAPENTRKHKLSEMTTNSKMQAFVPKLTCLDLVVNEAKQNHVFTLYFDNNNRQYLFPKIVYSHKEAHFVIIPPVLMTYPIGIHEETPSHSSLVPTASSADHVDQLAARLQDTHIHRTRQATDVEIERPTYTFSEEFMKLDPKIREPYEICAEIFLDGYCTLFPVTAQKLGHLVRFLETTYTGTSNNLYGVKENTVLYNHVERLKNVIRDGYNLVTANMQGNRRTATITYSKLGQRCIIPKISVMISKGSLIPITEGIWEPEL
jgi:hypothetical protein